MNYELLRWAEKSLGVQNACNGMGVANSLVQLMGYLRDNGITEGTTENNTHPLVQLFVAKLADLACLDYKYPAEAHMLAREIADAPYRKESRHGELEVRPV
jgi:hypothetical protein